MKTGSTGGMYRAPCATALPPRQVRAGAITCSFSSVVKRLNPFASQITCSGLKVFKIGRDDGGHISFIKEVAATNPPEHPDELLKLLQTRGDTIVSPGSKQGLIPLATPLSENVSGAGTALLRWPTDINSAQAKLNMNLLQDKSTFNSAPQGNLLQNEIKEAQIRAAHAHICPAHDFQSPCTSFGLNLIICSQSHGAAFI